MTLGSVLPAGRIYKAAGAAMCANLVGIGLATVLLGTFFAMYGPGFLGLLVVMFGSGPPVPDH